LYNISGLDRRRHCLWVILITSLILAYNPVYAHNWESSYGTDLTVGYDDNIRLQADDEIDTTSIDLGVFAGMESETEISSVRLAIGVNSLNYSESSIEDESSYNLSLDAARSGERLSSSLNALLETQLLTETELLGSGLLEDGSRDTTSITPGLSFQVDERTSVSASLSLQDVSYDTVSLTDFTDTSLSLSWSYGLDEASSISTDLGYSIYDPDDGDETDSSSVSLGYLIRTSEATNFNFSFGFTSVDRPDDSEDGSNYSFGVDHRLDESNSFTLMLSNSFEASGQGEVREETGLNLQWDHDFSERSQFTLSAEGQYTDDRDYFSIQAEGDYEYTREIGFSASYRYRESEEGSENANSSTILFSLSYSPI